MKERLRFFELLGSSNFFIRIWIGSILIFVIVVAYSLWIPPVYSAPGTLPLRSYLLSGVVIIGSLSFLLSTIFSLKEGNKHNISKLVFVARSAMFVALFPTVLLAFIVFYELGKDTTQWIIYPLFLFTLGVIIISKLLIKKLLSFMKIRMFSKKTC